MRLCLKPNKQNRSTVFGRTGLTLRDLLLLCSIYISSRVGKFMPILKIQRLWQPIGPLSLNHGNETRYTEDSELYENRAVSSPFCMEGRSHKALGRPLQDSLLGFHSILPHSQMLQPIRGKKTDLGQDFSLRGRAALNYPCSCKSPPLTHLFTRLD